MPDDASGAGTDVIKTLGQVLGLVAGVLGLVYAAGGGALALRLYLADLPSRTVVAQLPRDLLISIGLSQIVLPALGVAALYAVVRLLVGNARPPSRYVDEWERRPSWRAWQGPLVASAIVAVAALAFVGVLLWLNVTTDLDKVLPSLILTFLLTLLVTLVALNLRARIAVRARRPEARDSEKWNARSAVLQMTLVVALASLPFWIVFAGTIKLLDATVCVTSNPGVHVVSGVLIGETNNRTYVGETQRKRPRRVFSIPQSQIIETIIGGRADVKKCLQAEPKAKPA